MSCKKIISLFIFFICTPLLLWASLRLKYYEIMHLQPGMEFHNISDLDTERIVFHSFHDVGPDRGYLPRLNHNKDKDFAELLIIRPTKVYLIKDGFEDPAKLKARKDQHTRLVSAWGEKRKAQRDLLEFSKEQIEVEQRAGKQSPDYARLENLITLTLRRYDKVLRELRRGIEREEKRLRQTRKYLGVSSGEYKKYQAVLDELQKGFEERESALKKDLRKRALSESENSLFIYRVERGEENKEKAASPSSVAEAKESSFFAEDAPPPSLGKAAFHRNMSDGLPDYVAMSLPGKTRPFFQRLDSEKENWVKDNLGAFYKSIRNKLVQRYANQYKELLLRPYKYNARIEGSFSENDPLCKIEQEEVEKSKEQSAEEQTKASQNERDAKTHATKDPEKAHSFYTRIDIYSHQGTHYTVLDCDHDGVVESFFVYEVGGLHWSSRKELPNTISIFNNRDPEIKEIIGDLITIESQGDTEIFSDFKKKEKEIQKSIEDKIKQEELRSLIHKQ